MSDDKMFEELILNGALEFSGVDIETGEMLYNFTEKLKDINPELHNEFSNYFRSEITALWQYGFLDMDISSAEPVVMIAPKALDPEQVAKLDKEKQYTLREIIRVILNKE